MRDLTCPRAGFTLSAIEGNPSLLANSNVVVEFDLTQLKILEG